MCRSVAKVPPKSRDYLRILPIALLGAVPVPLAFGALVGHIEAFGVAGVVFGVGVWLVAIMVSRRTWRAAAQGVLDEVTTSWVKRFGLFLAGSLIFIGLLAVVLAAVGHQG